VVSIPAEGRYAGGRAALPGRSAEAVADALRAAHAAPETRLIISADAQSTHQAVVTAMEAAQRVGLSWVTFPAQNPGGVH
jgi:biopolymer transport protein ExbD